MKTTITAHAGAMNTKENTIESLRVCLKNADIVEFDLYITEDGQALLSHDKPKGDEDTLEDAMKLLTEYKNVKYNIDVKSDFADISIIQKLADKYSVTSRVFMTGIDEKMTARAKEQCPDIPYYLNCKVRLFFRNSDAYIQKLIDKVKLTGAVGINFSFKRANEKIVTKFHEEGLLVSLFTPTKEKELQKAVSTGADNITTRDPLLLDEMLKKQ